MISIPLSRNLFAIADNEDSDLFNFIWYAVPSDTTKEKHYAIMNETVDSVRKNGKPYKQRHIHMHRLILERKLGRAILPSEQCDHVNGDTLDNRRENLRPATISQNQANKVLPNKTGFKGVKKATIGTRWEANIKKDGKPIYLGMFKTPEEAHKAYCEAAVKYHGEFAKFK